MPLPSWIWKHLLKHDDGKVECLLCHKKMSIKGGTTTLKYHLEKSHFFKAPIDVSSKVTLRLSAPKPTSLQASSSEHFPMTTGQVSFSAVSKTGESDVAHVIEELEVDTSCRDASGRMVKASSSKQAGAVSIAAKGQSVLSEWLSVTPKRLCSTARASELTKMAINCVVKDLQPLSFCEDSGMRDWLLFMEPNYQPPSHKTMREHLLKIYDLKRNSLMSEMQGIEVSITVDGWTNSQMVGFFSVMAHYITDEFDLRCYNLDSPTIDGRHTGENVAVVIDSTLKDWEIECFACVHDTAANMNKGLRLAEMVRYDFGCFAHILQLAINDALKDSSGGNVAAIINKIREVVKYKGRSENFSREIRTYRDQLFSNDTMKKWELQLDCDTRWNSTCIMLESFLNLQTAVDLAVKSVFTGADKKKFYFSPDEVSLVKDIVNLLENLKKTTDQWQGQKFVTVSTIYPVIFAVIDSMTKLEKMCSDGEKLKRNLIANIKDRLCMDDDEMDDDEFLGSMSIPMIATFFDPRFKKLSFATREICQSVKLVVRDEVLKLSVSPEQAEPDSAVHSAVSVTTVSGSSSPPSKRPFLEELLADQHGSPDSGHECDEVGEYERLRSPPLSSDPLKWWKDHQSILPVMSKLARRYLSVPATSASSERLFSAYGLVFEQRRMSLSKDTASAIVFLHENDKS